MQFFANLEPAAPREIFPELTVREREILSFIASGQTNAEIAEKLVISMKTVRNHVSNIFSKLQVADRAQAAIRAREAGLGASRTGEKPHFLVKCIFTRYGAGRVIFVHYSGVIRGLNHGAGHQVSRH